MKQYIKPDEAAQIAQVTRQTIMNWIKEKVITSRRKRCSSGYTYEVSFQSLMNLINNTTIPADEQAIDTYTGRIKEQLLTLQQEWRTLLATQEAVATLPEVRRTILRIITSITPDEKYERGFSIIKELLRGNSYEDIAQKYQLTRNRVRQIVEITLRHPELINSYDIMQRKILSMEQQLKQLTLANKMLTIERDSIKSQMTTNAKPLKPTEINAQLLATEITDLYDHFSTRVCRALTIRGINTVHDLLRCDFYDLSRIRNFGRRSIIEVEDFLEEHGLEMGMLKYQPNDIPQ